MWKTLATILVGVVPGIIIGMAIAAFFVSAPLKTQIDLAQKAEKKAIERTTDLQLKLDAANGSIKSLKDAGKVQSDQTNLNIEDIRQVCREENSRAVKSGQAIAEIRNVLPKQAQAVKDLAASCPPNPRIDAGLVRRVIGQD